MNAIQNDLGGCSRGGAKEHALPGVQEKKKGPLWNAKPKKNKQLHSPDTAKKRVGSHRGGTRGAKQGRN